MPDYVVVIARRGKMIRALGPYTKAQAVNKRRSLLSFKVRGRHADGHNYELEKFLNDGGQISAVQLWPSEWGSEQS